MSEALQIGDQVVLKTFQGSHPAPPEVDESENYWKLIGLSGVIVEKKSSHPAFPQLGERALVKFDNNPKDYGLHCHNSVGKSLWIFILDLDKKP